MIIQNIPPEMSSLPQADIQEKSLLPCRNYKTHSSAASSLRSATGKSYFDSCSTSKEVRSSSKWPRRKRWDKPRQIRRTGNNSQTLVNLRIICRELNDEPDQADEWNCPQTRISVPGKHPTGMTGSCGDCRWVSVYIAGNTDTGSEHNYFRRDKNIVMGCYFLLEN